MMNKKTARMMVVLAVVVGAIAVFKILGLGRYFTLSYLKASKERFAALYAEHRLMVPAAYVVTYILVTSLSLPGASIMTLAGGALFGLWMGTLIVSFASTIGATLACSVSRFLLRDWVQHRFGDRLSTVNEGMEREGAFYLFTLRMIPVFPFFVINLVMGLTRMHLSTFYWVSQIGMLPGTVVYVNTGRELARIESLSGILSPRLIVSFSLAGLFPYIARKAIALYKSRGRGRQHGE